MNILKAVDHDRVQVGEKEAGTVGLYPVAMFDDHGYANNMRVLKLLHDGKVEVREEEEELRVKAHCTVLRFHYHG